MERTACLSSLDNDGGIGDQCHSPIAHDEILSLDWISNGKLRDRQVRLHDLFLQQSILLRENLIQRRAKNSYSFSSSINRRSMPSRINALGQTANNDHLLLCKRLRDFSSNVEGLLRCFSGPNDCGSRSG